MVYLGKFTANVQKRLKPGSFRADFLYDEKKTKLRKQAQNSYIEWHWLRGEIEVLKFEEAIFSNFDYYRDLYKTQLIRKWKWHFPSKWGAKLANLNWPRLMGLNL